MTRLLAGRTVRYLLRILAAGVCFAVAAAGLLVLVGTTALELTDVTGIQVTSGIAAVVATALALVCMPSEDRSARSSRRSKSGGVWDTFDGVPVAPDGPGPPWRWYAELEDLYAWDPYESPYGYQIRPAVPPGDDGGRDE